MFMNLISQECKDGISSNVTQIPSSTQGWTEKNLVFKVQSDLKITLQAVIQEFVQ